jgi:hypothetical protein
MFAMTSRYHGIPTASLGTIVYVRRRFLPQPDQLAQIGEHTVAVGERLDHIAAEQFGDPEQAWRIADANRATDPAALEVPGRRLRITLPPGLPRGGVLGAINPAAIVGIPGTVGNG